MGYMRLLGLGTMSFRQLYSSIPQSGQQCHETELCSTRTSFPGARCIRTIVVEARPVYPAVLQINLLAHGHFHYLPRIPLARNLCVHPPVTDVESEALIVGLGSVCPCCKEITSTIFPMWLYCTLHWGETAAAYKGVFRSRTFMACPQDMSDGGPRGGTCTSQSREGPPDLLCAERSERHCLLSEEFRGPFSRLRGAGPSSDISCG